MPYIRLLVQRFGPLPDDIQARLDNASIEELDAWLDAVMDVPSLEALFVEQPPA